jgi:hypothetical protein
MIISASRRTDLPAFFAPWLMNRLRAGTALAQNPFNPKQVSRLVFSPEAVDCLVLWTKDPGPMERYLDELEGLGYRLYFQCTVTPYGKELEPRMRDKDAIAATVARLGERLGRERVRWRYDPIILSGDMTVAWHAERFSRLCGILAHAVNGVTISFADQYQWMKKGLIRQITEDEQRELGAALGGIAAAHGLLIETCCEGIDLSEYGIGRGSCIDRAVIERICGYPLKLGRDRGQRPDCGCYESVDIGVYSTCPGGCAYCYAARSAAALLRNAAAYDPEGELLCGVLPPDAVVRERIAESNRLCLLG